MDLPIPDKFVLVTPCLAIIVIPAYWCFAAGAMLVKSLVNERQIWILGNNRRNKRADDAAMYIDLATGGRS